MLNKTVKTGLIQSLLFALVACTNIIPQNPVRPPNVKINDDFSPLENEYRFKTEALTKSYLQRKLNFWLTEPVQEENLVKEIAYAGYKHREIFCSIMEEDQIMYGIINNITAVSTRKTYDPNFKSFLEGCIEVPPPIIGEFRVNTYTTNDQSQSYVAMDADGDFVITWFSDQDGDSLGIYAQRFGSNGLPAGSEFRVNTTTSGVQQSNTVGMDAAGDFVIAWTSYGGQDGNNNGVFAQRYDSSGIAAGSEFKVNSYYTGDQDSASMAMNSDGDFVIAWVSKSQDYGGSGIYAQRYFSGGTTNGSEFRVNTFTSGGQVRPSVAMDNNGNFVITWEGEGDGDIAGIYGQRFDSAGIIAGSEFKVNTILDGYQFWPTIGMDDDGDFVIAWVSYDSREPDGNTYAQRYNSSGTPQGSEFQVNTHTTKWQTYPTATMDSDGDFVITWASWEQDGDAYGIYAQRYNSGGTPQGTEFRVNSHTTSYQNRPWVAMDNTGDFIITWLSTYQDGNGFGIFGQRYDSSGTAR
jgi:hypothetical protein